MRLSIKSSLIKVCARDVGNQQNALINSAATYQRKKIIINKSSACELEDGKSYILCPKYNLRKNDSTKLRQS